MNVSVKSYISSLIVIFSLMVLALILTFIVPSGEYVRTISESGKEIIESGAAFNYVDSDFKFYKWILSPILVLTADGSLTIILVIIFLVVIGGIFNILYERDLIRYMINKIVYKFGNKRYLLLALLQLVFMLLGSFIGSFEEAVPLVPIVVSLVTMLGFDPLVGLSVSIVSCGCGFATGIMNPFTVGVAQSIAGVQMYSGAWLRIVSFILIYCLLFSFVYFYSKKIAKNSNNQINENDENSFKFEYDKKKDKAINSFIITLLIGIILIVSSAVITALQDYTMVIVALMFLVGGTCAGFLSGMKVKPFFKSFLKGVIGVLPAVLMILMASSIKYTLEESKILDTIMHFFVEIIPDNKILVILSIYLIVLVMNFFIASGSAKAFLLIPLIVPIANMFGVSSQLCILAYIFGDGFSNVLYPTNPVLLISLGLTDTSYTKYFKYIWKFQLPNLILTSLILIFGLIVGY